MESPHWRFSLKKVITSLYSKSSNSSGFNPILQKFYEMICEIIVSSAEFFCFLVNPVLLIVLWRRTIFRSRKIASRISRPIYFKKMYPHRFEDRICTNKLDAFFFRKTFFSRTWSFFHDWKAINLGVIFFHKKLIFHFFSKVII